MLAWRGGPQSWGRGEAELAANVTTAMLPLVRDTSSPEGFLGEATSAHEMAQRWLWPHGQPVPTRTDGQSEALFMPVVTVLCSIVCEHTHTHTHDFTLKQTFNKG